jgi:hypothetical protein
MGNRYNVQVEVVKPQNFVIRNLRKSVAKMVVASLQANGLVPTVTADRFVNFDKPKRQANPKALAALKEYREKKNKEKVKQTTPVMAKK